MKGVLLVLVCWFFCCGHTLGLGDGKKEKELLPLPEGMVSLLSNEGQERLLQRETRKQDFFYLSSYFETQKTNTYCGVASSVILLNSLPLMAPIDAVHGYPFWNQENYFTAQLALEGITPYNFNGLVLSQLSTGLQVHGCDTEMVYAKGDESKGLSKFRNLLVESLDDPTNFVLVNYQRDIIGEEGGGHISPIAAYHLESDSVLLMDVARYKYEPAWVDIKKLYKSMQTIDHSSNEVRGYVFVWAKK